MKLTRRLAAAAMVLGLASLSGCSGPTDPELAGFCQRLVTTIQLNEKATEHGVERSPEELAEQMSEAALASGAFSDGAGPADVEEEMRTVSRYHSGEPGLFLDEEYFEAYFAVLGYAVSNCEGISMSQNGTMHFTPNE